MKTECTTLRNTINQSVQVVCSVYYRLWRNRDGTFSQYQTQCELAKPGEALARRPVGCRLSLKFSLQNKDTDKGKGTWH